MIHHLRIAAFATIEEISVSFDEGLTVITGETGAGKSLLVDALFLVSGLKPRGLTVRPGADEGIVEAVFSPISRPIPDSLSEILSSNDEIVIRRIISPNGRIRQTLNGQSIAISQLQSLVGLLFDIVGQGENGRLGQSDVHRQVLDSFSGIEDLSEGFERCRRTILSLRKERDNLKDKQQRLSMELEERARMKEDCQLLSGRPGEYEDLSQTLTAQLNLQEILIATGRSYETLYEDDHSILSSLKRITSDLDHILPFDQTLQPVRKDVEEAVEILKDAAHELKQYQESLEMDPERLSMLETRFNLYRRLAQKYQVHPEHVATFLENASEESAPSFSQEIEQIERAIKSEEEHLKGVGEEIRSRRAEAAHLFSEEVRNVLRRLRIEFPAFSVSFTPYADWLSGSYGPDRIEFLFSANPGLPPRPLAQVASGGEMSRVLLSIKSVLADSDMVPTLIFDEIDSGIGGEVGEVLGDLLKEIGHKRQVLAITHLHQVARKGHHHLLVRKASEEGVTRTSVSSIEGEERVREIARMLGGEHLSPSTMQIAKDLLS